MLKPVAVGAEDVAFVDLVENALHGPAPPLDEVRDDSSFGGGVSVMKI